MSAENALALLPGLTSEKINVIQAHEFTGRKQITEIQLPGTKYRFGAQKGRLSEEYCLVLVIEPRASHV